MQQDSLTYAVRLGVVLKYTGQLSLVAAVLTLLPLVFSLFSGDYDAGIRYGLVGAVLSLSGLAASRLSPPRRVQHNEALVIAAGMFVIISLLMTVPMMGAGLSFIDAWFESTSAVTTTGLSTTRTVEDKPASFLLGRAWMQWYGGLGVVDIGSAKVTIMTAKRLIDLGHEVIIIESDRAVIEELSDTIDCGFLHGDGSSPEVLREAAPKASDILFCLTGQDQINIIAALVGRSLGFKRVVASIADAEFEPVCQELGLEDTIVSARTISRYLADMAAGLDIVELHTVIKEEGRLFSFTASDEDAGDIDKLDLPSGSRVVWFYRQGKFHLADEAVSLKTHDEVIIATHSRNLERLRERWQPKNSAEA